MTTTMLAAFHLRVKPDRRNGKIGAKAPDKNLYVHFRITA
jgi:hypothetical protein